MYGDCCLKCHQPEVIASTSPDAPAELCSRYSWQEALKNRFKKCPEYDNSRLFSHGKIARRMRENGGDGRQEATEDPVKTSLNYDADQSPSQYHPNWDVFDHWAMGARTRLYKNQIPSQRVYDRYGNQLVKLGYDHYNTSKMVYKHFDPVEERARLESGRIDEVDVASLSSNNLNHENRYESFETIEPCWREEFLRPSSYIKCSLQRTLCINRRQDSRVGQGVVGMTMSREGAGGGDYLWKSGCLHKVPPGRSISGSCGARGSE